jgi:hypothetical protein
MKEKNEQANAAKKLMRHYKGEPGVGVTTVPVEL